MKRGIGLALLSLTLALPAPAAADGPVAGNWKVTVLSPSGTVETTNFVIKLETEDGKTTAELVAASAAYKNATLARFSLEGDKVAATLKLGGAKGTAKGGKGATPEIQLEGRLVGQDGKKIVGALSGPGQLDAVYLTPTEMTELAKADVVRDLKIEAMEQANRYSNIAEAAPLYRRVLTQHAGTFTAGRAALTLLQIHAEGTAAELKQWAETAATSAAEFGPKYQMDITSQIAAALVERRQAALAIEFAQAAEKLLNDKSTLEAQVSVVRTLQQALKIAGPKADLKIVADRLAKLERQLDGDYLAKTPPFKAEHFSGRKGKSDRVAVFELFTGAQCPPCVAADVAFDALTHAYLPKDLVLLQYHLHIPGPDPMTNKDTEARWAHYRQAHGSKNVGGVPTAIFNGTKLKVGGGGMDASKSLYANYCRLIDPLLETDSSCQIKATARRVGGKVLIEAAVTGLENPGSRVRLRLALAEETIRFVGSNKVRFHHQVVRAMAGSPAGIAIKDKNFKTQADVDLPGLRKTLTAYLDDYALNVRPFPIAGRPMDFRNLRVVAFVQDDETHEILQAVQVEVVE